MRNKSSVKADGPTIPLLVGLRWLMDQGFVGSRRTMFRHIGTGEFPQPDCKVGKKLAWKRKTILEWYNKL